MIWVDIHTIGPHYIDIYKLQNFQHAEKYIETLAIKLHSSYSAV